MASPSGHDDPVRAPASPDAESAPQPAEPLRATSGSRPTLIGDRGDAVAFLDAPGVDSQQVLDAVDTVLARMPDGAILTVFTDDPAAPHLAANCAADRDVELLAVIPHGDRTGTTLTFRRARPRRDPMRPV